MGFSPFFADYVMCCCEDPVPPLPACLQPHVTQLRAMQAVLVVVLGVMCAWAWMQDPCITPSCGDDPATPRTLCYGALLGTAFAQVAVWVWLEGLVQALRRNEAVHRTMGMPDVGGDYQ